MAHTRESLPVLNKDKIELNQSVSAAPKAKARNRIPKWKGSSLLPELLTHLKFVEGIGLVLFEPTHTKAKYKQENLSRRIKLTNKNIRLRIIKNTRIIFVYDAENPFTPTDEYFKQHKKTLGIFLTQCAKVYQIEGFDFDELVENLGKPSLEETEEALKNFNLVFATTFQVTEEQKEILRNIEPVYDGLKDQPMKGISRKTGMLKQSLKRKKSDEEKPIDAVTEPEVEPKKSRSSSAASSSSSSSSSSSHEQDWYGLSHLKNTSTLSPSLEDPEIGETTSVLLSMDDDDEVRGPTPLEAEAEVERGPSRLENENTDSLPMPSPMLSQSGLYLLDSPRALGLTQGGGGATLYSPRHLKPYQALDIDSAQKNNPLSILMESKLI